MAKSKSKLKFPNGKISDSLLQFAEPMLAELRSNEAKAEIKSSIMIAWTVIKTPRFLPDLHYSFLEYGGSNITSYSFAAEGGIRHDRLVGDEVLIITDKDKDKWKAQRRERIKAAVQGTLICPEALEIENLLSPAVIAKVVAEYEKKSVPALEAVKWESYRNKRLGTYLETVIGKSERRSKSGSPYSQASGTLKDKVNFCMRALKYMAVEGDLTAEAMDAAKRLYEFIAQANARPHCDRQAG